MSGSKGFVIPVEVTRMEDYLKPQRWLDVAMTGTAINSISLPVYFRGIVMEWIGIQELYDIASKDTIIVLRDIPGEQAKREVKELLISSPQPLDHGEIADELRLDLKLVAQVCAELIREGVIEFA